ncbi:MAG: hypothetical protein KA230_04500 [Flavobacteriales bacterium]|nr:hypothetical protein [Flavobacteriales bacterium]
MSRSKNNRRTGRTYAASLIVAILYSCGGSTAPGLSQECVQFLDGYEKYVDDYIALLKDYKSNPTDLSLMERTTNMATEAQVWGNKAPDCKNAAAFLTRQAKIQAKLSMASFSL